MRERSGQLLKNYTSLLKSEWDSECRTIDAVMHIDVAWYVRDYFAGRAAVESEEAAGRRELGRVGGGARGVSRRVRCHF